MALKETFVRARVDERLKRDTERILGHLGLTTTEAIRIFLHQVRRTRGLPFAVRLREDNSDLLRSASQRQAALDALYDD